MTRDQVRDVRIFDAATGSCEALVHFFRLADAETFMDRYFPSFALPSTYPRGRDSTPITVGVNFGQSRDEMAHYDSRYDARAEGEDDWECMSVSFFRYGLSGES